MPEATLSTYNGYTLHVTEEKTVMYDTRHKPVRTWTYEDMKWKPTEPGFMDYMKTKAEIWLVANFIHPAPIYHIEDYETAWPLLDQDGDMLFCPDELTKTKAMAQETLDAINQQPQTIELTVKQKTNDTGSTYLYHKLYVVLTDPDMNQTLDELKESMKQAVNQHFAPKLDTSDWIELVKYVPPCVTNMFGFSITNKQKEYTITI